MKVFAIDNRGTLLRFRNLNVTHFDSVIENSFIKGFWGRSNNGTGMVEDGIWASNLKPEIPPAKSDVADFTAVGDSKK